MMFNRHLKKTFATHLKILEQTLHIFPTISECNFPYCIYEKLDLAKIFAFSSGFTSYESMCFTQREAGKLPEASIDPNLISAAVMVSLPKGKKYD